ncbi:MAG TPA: leucine-rich repeat protein [Acholeplasma sp.]|jgi:hypothetical protein|nr:leucine-rich repeat protein [Acholeplasma sp.]
MQTSKRYLALLITFLLVFVLVGCGERKYDYDKTGILTDGVFNYKIVEGVKTVYKEDEYGVPYQEEVDDSYVVIVNTVKRHKTLEIPEMIDNKPVREIADYAFFEYTKLFGLVTISKSKLKEIVFPNTLEKIGKFAFYQNTKLESIHIPGGVKLISESAFAGCTNVKRLTITRDEPDYEYYTSDSTDANPIIIEGARSSYVGDILTLRSVQANAEGETVSAPATWASSNPRVISIDADTGTVTAKEPGFATITAVSRSGDLRASTVIMEVKASDTTKVIGFEQKSLDRFNDLRELVLEVQDVALLNVPQGFLKLNSKVKIYVPDNAVAFYKAAKIWVDFADRIQPMSKLPE